MAATAVTAVAGIAIAGYIVVFRPGQVPDTGAAIAAAAVSSSRAMAVLEEQRQQMIVLSAATHSVHLIGAPKVAAQPLQDSAGGGSGSTVTLPPPDPGDGPAHRVRPAVFLRLEPEHVFQLPEQHLDPGKRLELPGGERQRRVWDSAGAAGQQDGQRWGRLSDRPQNADHLGPWVYPG